MRFSPSSAEVYPAPHCDVLKFGSSSWKFTPFMAMPFVEQNSGTPNGTRLGAFFIQRVELETKSNSVAQQHETDLNGGALVVIDELKARVRILPI